MGRHTETAIWEYSSQLTGGPASTSSLPWLNAQGRELLDVGDLLQLAQGLEVGGNIAEADHGCADGRASDLAPPSMLLDHHEREVTSVMRGHWRRRWDGEPIVVEGDNTRMDLDREVLLSGFLCCLFPFGFLRVLVGAKNKNR
jgi:hypothetical protein